LGFAPRGGATARKEWYDRNPAVRFLQYSADGAAPHTDTERWNYTIPTGKKAFAEASELEIVRATAASAAGLVMCRVNYRPSGGIPYRLLTLRMRTNGVGDARLIQLGHSVTLLAGDALYGYTADQSTGGTMDYTETVKITEFDA